MVECEELGDRMNGLSIQIFLSGIVLLVVKCSYGERNISKQRNGLTSSRNAWSTTNNVGELPVFENGSAIWQRTLNDLTSTRPGYSRTNGHNTTQKNNKLQQKAKTFYTKPENLKYNEETGFKITAKTRRKKRALKKAKRNTKTFKLPKKEVSEIKTLSGSNTLQKRFLQSEGDGNVNHKSGVDAGNDGKYVSKRQHILPSLLIPRNNENTQSENTPQIHKYYSNGVEHRYVGGAIHRYLSKPIDLEAITGRRINKAHNLNRIGHTNHLNGGMPRIGSIKSIPFIGPPHVDAIGNIGDGGRIIQMGPKIGAPIMENIGGQTHISGLEGFGGPVHVGGNKGNMAAMEGNFGPGSHFDRMDAYSENRFGPPKLMGAGMGDAPIHMTYPVPPPIRPQSHLMTYAVPPPIRPQSHLMTYSVPPPIRPHNHLMIINRPVHHTLRIPVPVPVQGPSKIIVVNRPVPMPPKRVPIPVMVSGPPLPPRLLVVHHHHIMNGPCEEKPCRNGGSCSAVGSDFKCVCALGYKGDRCEVQSKCIPNPCKNFGKCTELVGDYECTCHIGFHGKNCDVESKCEPSPCRNGGICTETQDNYICTCKQGFMGKNCEQESKCHPVNPCQNNGVCKEDLTGYKCICPDNFGGINCEVHLSNSGCDSSPCHNGGTCISDTGDPSRFVCTCAPGFAGQSCQEKGSSDAQCVEGSCMLKNGPPSQVPSGSCGVINPCLFGGTCIPRSYSFDCVCPDGRGGIHCEVSLSSICDRCSRHAYCKESKCICRPGYTGNGIHCRKKKTRCHPNPCENGGTCHEQSHMYTNEMEWYCECMKGYSGTRCTVYDPCTDFKCHNGGQCEIVNLQPQCKCLPPFEGPTCELENLCLPSGGKPRNPCLNGGTCQFMNGKVQCICPIEYEGINCEKNKCDKCDPNALCTNGVCVCKPGYTGDGYECELPPGRSPPSPSSPPPDHCKPDPCTNGATCVDGRTTFFCICPEDYYGRTCSQRREVKVIYKERNDYEYALCHPNPCLHGGLCKEISTKDFECICANPRYKGRFCDVDMCSECDVHARCVHGKCICRDGYEGDGYTCNKVVEKCGPCPMYAQCDSDVCVCRPGYTWSHDQPTSKRSCVAKPALSRKLKTIENSVIRQSQSPAPQPSSDFRDYNYPAPAQPVQYMQDNNEHARRLSQFLSAQTQRTSGMHKQQSTAKLPKAKQQEWSEDIIVTEYQSLGCWADTTNWRDSKSRALISLEGLDPRIMEDYHMRKQPISKCAEIARGLGYKLFAIQNGGQCFSGPMTRNYKIYGPSEKCKNGVGGSLANDVYSL